MFSLVTGIDEFKNISVSTSYGTGEPVAIRMNINTAGSTSVNQMFSNGIVNGVMFGGDGNFPQYVSAGGNSVTTLSTSGGDGSGEVFDGRLRADGSLILVGNGTTSNGFGLTAWRNGALYRTYDLGADFGYAGVLDPTGYLAFASYGTGLLASWDLEANIFTPLGLSGTPLGVLTGTSNTYLFQNSADNNRLWTYNSTIGVNGRTADVCASTPSLQCGAFSSILLGMGKMNLSPDDLAMIEAAFRGSSYGDQIRNPGANITSTVPEPGTGKMMGSILALGFILWGLKQLRPRRTAIA